NFFVQGDFDYQWRNEFRSASGESQSPAISDPLAGGNMNGGTFWQNHSRDITYRQKSTTWQGKLMARYVFPRQIAASMNLRHQSGFPCAPIFRANMPGSVTQPICLQNTNDNRSKNITLVAVRLQATVTLAVTHR